MITAGRDEMKLPVVTAKEFPCVGRGSLQFGWTTSSRSDNTSHFHSLRPRQDLLDVRKIANNTFSPQTLI